MYSTHRLLLLPQQLAHGVRLGGQRAQQAQQLRALAGRPVPAAGRVMGGRVSWRLVDAEINR